MITKIDIINGKVLCFDEEATTPPTITDENEASNTLLETFGDTQDLLTINITNPVKRVMKFYNINGGQPESSEELPYSEMSEADKEVLDTYIETI